MMRALVMDFAGDTDALDINDQYMFGKSILVCPVTESMYTKSIGTGRGVVHIADFTQTKSRKVYLPKGTDWYDFWTNEKLEGGQTIERQAPLDLMPLYIKAGSIIPFGPEVQYATEKPWDNLEIRVYAGANGTFTLYEDEFDNYNYEKGEYAEIPFEWNDASRQLTVGARKGAYNGMLKNRKFTIVLQDGTRKTIDYNGKKTEVKF